MCTSDDGYNWTSVDDDRVFEGNEDRNTHVPNTFITDPVARALRLYPITWYNQVALRWDANVQFVW